jgi:predicted nucleic acid-binding protein
VIVILDASTLINLANGEVLAIVIAIPGIHFRVSEAVRKESKTVAREIEHAVSHGQLDWVDADTIDAAEYETALAVWGLGAGETECFLAARKLNCRVACDDGSARKVISRHCSEIQLTGSIGMLRMAIAAGLLTREAAFAAYRLMIERGGYLPEFAITQL